jgi:hypothetical protein
MTHILFYRESNTMARDYAYMDRLISMFGFIPIAIDRSLEEETHYDGHAYPSLSRALTDPRWDGFTWIWMDHRGSRDLESFHHPLDGAIYCIGSDTDGFQNIEHPGDRLRLPDDMGGETFASLVMPVLLAHLRWGG